MEGWGRSVASLFEVGARWGQVWGALPAEVGFPPAHPPTHPSPPPAHPHGPTTTTDEHLYRQPRLLICDEATSALDSGTEAGIMGSLAELAAGRTAVFVAHRLSTVQASRAAWQGQSGCMMPALVWMVGLMKHACMHVWRLRRRQEMQLARKAARMPQPSKGDAGPFYRPSNPTRPPAHPHIPALQNCDRIYVLSDGVVAEQGTHRQLMAGAPEQNTVVRVLTAAAWQWLWRHVALLAATLGSLHNSMQSCMDKTALVI